MVLAGIRTSNSKLFRFPTHKTFFSLQLVPEVGNDPWKLLEKEAEDAVESGFLVLLLSRCLIT